MLKLFEQKTRDRAIETTCQNLIMAGGILTSAEVANYMRDLTGYEDVRLALTLLTSRELLDQYLANQSQN